jgi:hypothetical protein
MRAPLPLVATRKPGGFPTNQVQSAVDVTARSTSSPAKCTESIAYPEHDGFMIANVRYSNSGKSSETSLFLIQVASSALVLTQLELRWHVVQLQTAVTEIQQARAAASAS